MFTEWLKQELKSRAWSQNELARRAGISQFAVSSVLSGKRKPGATFCVKVAQAFRASPVYALQLAGILPEDTKLPAGIDDEAVKEILTIARNLPPEKRAEALRYLRFLYQNRNE
jgi:transcriptional regulator with XRE-family HTH domain